MGLLDKLGIGGTKEERESRSVQKLQKKVLTKFGPPENRQEAIEELGTLRTEAAVEALLQRFTIRTDPGITDDDEKQRVYELVRDAGATALPPLDRFVRSRDEISWPLKLLSEMLPEAQLVQLLVAVAQKSATEYSRVPEKKVLLLHALAGHRSPEIPAAVEPFLEDMQDDVQIAAAQVLASQEQETCREPLIRALLRAHQASNARVAEALAGLLSESTFDVKGFTGQVEAALPDRYKLDGKARVVRAN